MDFGCTFFIPPLVRSKSKLVPNARCVAHLHLLSLFESKMAPSSGGTLIARSPRIMVLMVFPVPERLFLQLISAYSPKLFLSVLFRGCLYAWKLWTGVLVSLLSSSCIFLVDHP